VGADRHSDRHAAADAGRHYKREAALLDRLYDLLVKAIKLVSNFRLLLSLGQVIRHIAEAVEVKGWLVKHLEVRVFADEVMQVAGQSEVFRE
jgi:hypothetical protein